MADRVHPPLPTGKIWRCQSPDVSGVTSWGCEPCRIDFATEMVRTMSQSMRIKARRMTVRFPRQYPEVERALTIVDGIRRNQRARRQGAKT